MSEVTHGQTGTTTTDVPAAAPAGDDPARTAAVDLTQVLAGDELTAEARQMCAELYPAGTTLTAGHVRAAARLADLTMVVRTLRHYVLDPEMLQLAELLDGAADRELAFLRDPAGEIGDCGPGDEMWLAWAISRVFLGQEVPDAG